MVKWPEGEKLKKMREHLNWKQARAAEEIGVGLRFYQALEAGEKEPGYQTIKKIHSTFGFPELMAKAKEPKETHREQLMTQILTKIVSAEESVLETILGVLSRHAKPAKARQEKA